MKQRIRMIVALLLAGTACVWAQRQVEAHIGADIDYQVDGKRAYSSYFELAAPFRLATCDWDAAAGLVPWKSGMYDVSGFSVTNLSLRATKAIKITKTFELPLFGQVVANPASQHLYFIFGLTLKAL